MFTTKLEVDKHVENCLKKINSENERNVRCFAFAKLYFKVGDYEQARRYASIYINVKPQSAEAQQLLGKIYEKQGKVDAALDAYRASLELDPKQNNLVLKICELLASDNVNFDTSGARYFCEKAQSIDPNNPSIYTLKEKLIMLEGKDPDDVSRLLQKEMDARPTDVDIRVRLLRHLLQNNHVKEAYKHAYDIEHANLSTFTKSLRWYETVAEILLKYQKDNYAGLNWEFWMLLISTTDKLAELYLDERYGGAKTATEVVMSVFNFDQTLKVAADAIQGCPEKQLLQEFWNHYRGQLCLHLVTLMYKQAKKELIKYKEAVQLTLPLLFVSYHTQPVDLQSMWVNHTTEGNRQMVKRWNREASYRCSQAGHMILSLAKDRKKAIVEKAAQFSSGMWREQFLKKVFVTRDQQIKIKTSYFATCPQLVEQNLRLPDDDELSKFDEVAQLVNPDSLHHYIWMGLNGTLSKFKCSIFEGLPYSVKNLNQCGAESVTILDVQAFLYCAILCAQQQLDEQKHSIYYSSDRPQVLPASVTSQLGTANQAKWITSVYKMFKNDYSCDFSEVRLTLIRGIEAIRCVGNHGLDVKLLVLLGKTFAERAKTLDKQLEVEFNDSRAELYWRTALPLLEKLKNNQAISYSSNRLFEFKSKDMSNSEILGHIDDGKLFLAIQAMKKKDFEKALQLFETLKDPYASYYQAQIYKTKAEEQTCKNKESVTSEMRSQNIILLSRARDCLYLTFDRLRDPSVDRRHPLNTQLGTEIDKIERLLSRIDPDTRNECDGMSDENLSSISDHNFTFGNNSYLNGGGNITPKHATPLRMDSTRREARPSPERLDAQLKQLLASRDTTLTHILDQNRHMLESHKTLLDAINSFTVNTVEEMRTLRTSIDDLKHSIADLQNVTDSVSKMKREVADLKKGKEKGAAAVAQQPQLSEEDLYGLEEEFAGDYGVLLRAENVGLGQGLYPNVGKMAGNPLQYGPAAAALYPGLFPMLHYPGLMPQAGGLGYSPDPQIPDFRAFSQGLQMPGSYPQPAYTHASPLSQGGLSNVPLPQHSFQHSLPLPHPSYPPLQTVSQQPPLLQPHIPNLSSAPFPSLTTITSTRAPPVNVVITSSDPLPSTNTNPQPILSVTIPPHHLKGGVKPHNYQIQLPVTTTVSTPTVMSQSVPIVATEGILSNVAPPIYSAVEKTPSKNTSLGFAIEKTLNESFGIHQGTTDASIASVANNSSSSLEEYDPCPDFKPIIPLPDEVQVSTGEEAETVLFEQRAKLFRYDNVAKEWKERGVGSLKLLKGDDGKVRVLMRREQVHKICANHYITKDIVVSQMPNNDKAYVWAANDFADQEIVLEKLCARFKTSDEAFRFYQAFEDSKKNLPDSPNKSTTSLTPNPDSTSKISLFSTPSKTQSTFSFATSTRTPSLTSTSATPAPSLGGFVFKSTPNFSPKDSGTPNAQTTPAEANKQSPFASFTFAKTAVPATTAFAPILTELKPSTVKVEAAKSTASFGLNFGVKTSEPKIESAKTEEEHDDSHVEEYEPNVEFKPVIPLPELIDVKTGEENAEVLFDSKAKLLRFDPNGKEWKERGIGQMKVLKFDDSVRFLMRREQVHKVCCNHQLLKNTAISFLQNNKKVLSWCAMDFSEGVLATEMFALRFKTEDQARDFLDTVTKAQVTLDENNCLVKSDKKVKSNEKSETLTTPQKPSGWGDKFKTKQGTWSCKNCYVVNEPKENYCVACDTPKNDTVAKKEAANSAQFSFGIKPPQNQQTTTAAPMRLTDEVTITPTWGAKFKPAADSWECEACLVRNKKDDLHCVSCDNPKDETVPKKDTNKLKGVNLDTPGLSFSFGMPATGNTEKGAAPSWGAAFKPAADSWECHMCLVRNKKDDLHCVSCDNHKDETVPKKDTNKLKGVNLDTPGVSFSFGMPATGNTEKVAPSWGAQFKPATDSWECQMCLVRNKKDDLHCVSCDNPKDDTVPKKDSSNNKLKGINLDTPGQSFSFGIPPATPANTPVTTVPNPALSFTFGTPSFSFGGAQPLPVTTTTTTTTTIVESSKPFSFNLSEAKPATESADKFEFGSPTKHSFEFTPRSPRRQSSGPGEEESEGSYVEEEEDTIYFKPVVPLPDKVEVRTGEEDEEVLYCHRAKLYRYTDGEWKERGLGDVKVLKDPKTGKLRVVMRREQVLKICLNHILTSDITYTNKDDKTWLFTAPDFSEGEIQHGQFCLRFKTSDVAEEFKTAIDKAVADETETEKGAPDVTRSSDSDSDDIEVIYETTVTQEEEDEAKSLGLPLKFMAYRQLEDCNCDECKKDDVLLKDILKDSTNKNTSKVNFGNSTSLFGTPLSGFSQGGSSIGTPENEKFSTPLSAAKSDTLKSLLAKPSLLNTSKSATEFSSPSLVNAASSPKINYFDNPPKENIFEAKSEVKPASSTFSFLTSKGEGPKSSIFGASNVFSATTQPSGTIFGAPAGSIFSGKPTFGATTGIFSTTTAGNIFGNSNIFSAPVTKSDSSTTGSVFQSPASNLFGVGSGAGNNPPDKAVAKEEKPEDLTAKTTTSIFGNVAKPAETTGTVFGGSQIFGKSAAFGANIAQATLSFGAVAAQADSTTAAGAIPSSFEVKKTADDTEKIVLTADSNLSFSALAETSGELPTFAQSTHDGENPFAFLGAGAPVFGAGRKNSANQSRSKEAKDEDADDEQDTTAGGDEEYDPHYEPIVPLPDQIVVSTGEEDETVMFNERTKLYRFDASTKEWKERGVGQLKVLHHPNNHTYRLLLRREQVHKVVLNQLITTDLDLQPLSTSDKAWCWVGYNYTEDGQNLEKLAARFKTPELATQFHQVITSAMESVQNRQSSTLPTTLEEIITPGAEEGRYEEEGAYEAHDEYDDYDDDDEDRSIMFRSHCILSEQIPSGDWKPVAAGEIQVCYDPDIFGARIYFTDDHAEHSNTMIGMNTVMSIQRKCCTWRAVEWANQLFEWRHLQASFDDEQTAEAFHMAYMEGVGYAEQSDIVDNLPSFGGEPEC